MTDDLVKRLRTRSLAFADDLDADAADRIEEQDKLIATTGRINVELIQMVSELQTALREISDHHIEGVIPEGHSFQSWTLQNYSTLKQTARAALGEKKDG